MADRHIARLASGVTIVAICLLAEIAAAELTLASLFSDNAVLQRDQPILVWGTADPGAEITVEFAEQIKTGTAGDGGNWQVALDPLAASFEPGVLTVQSSADDQKVTIGNLLVGEVWICSGQSNMQMPVGQVPAVKALLATSENIRSFTVKRTVSFSPQDTCKGRWVEEHPNSAVAFAFAYFLERAADVPVGIVLTCWGSSSIEAWMPRDMTESVPHFKTLMEEFDADEKTRERIDAVLNGKIPWSGREDIFLRRQPNILYNAMMHPLIPYACRGLVWYQGERNTQSINGMPDKPWFSRNSGMLKYGKTLKRWVARYRKEWKNDDLHFLVVMLPGYHKPLKNGPRLGPEHPDTLSWAWMRQSQLEVLDLSNTDVVNTIDLGAIGNVHPKDKLPIGERLALIAARKTLGRDVECHGPVFDRLEKLDSKLVVHFKNANGLTTSDGESPAGFWLADDSEKWVRADAALNNGSVILTPSESQPLLIQPLYVRYAFAGKPTVNLINGNGLPAFPFRTDRFAPRKATKTKE